MARTDRDPRTLGPTLTQIVRALDTSMPLAPTETLDEEVERTLAPRSSRFALVAVFGGIAGLLAIVGLGGALIHAVAERRRELAIRAAIGATPGALVQSVASQGAWVAGVGIALGTAASYASGRAASQLIFGVSAHDPLTYGATVAGMLLITALVCYLSARRAAHTDPLTLMRSE